MIPIAHNDPELNGKYLGTISADFIKVCDNLKEAAYLLTERKISDYPIFPVSRQILPIGKILIGQKERPELDLQWNYHFSFMEEFVDRGLIMPEALELFKSSWRDPEEYCCLFVVEPDFTNFVYIPYPED